MMTTSILNLRFYHSIVGFYPTHWVPGKAGRSPLSILKMVIIENFLPLKINYIVECMSGGQIIALFYKMRDMKT